MVVNEVKTSKYEVNTELALEYILTRKHGETIPYVTLANILRFSLQDEHQEKIFKRRMSKIKNILIDYGYVLKSVGGVGYYILKPNQISSFTFRNYIVKPQKAYEKANRILNHVDTTKLNEIGKEEHRYAKELAENIAETTENTIYNSNYWNNKILYEN